MFKKYQHLEKFGNTEVKDIEFGECYIFPKIDGTNASVWFEDGKVECGSRNRQLTLESDNAGFCRWVQDQVNLEDLFEAHPNIRLYGEWLVPHSLKTYRDTAWRNFYVFDVCIDDGDDVKYLKFEEYGVMLKPFGIDVIPPLVIIKNPTFERMMQACENNKFLLKENSGFGEGVVLKNYDFKNRFGRTTWAKIVTNEFKDKHVKEMGVSRINEKAMIEEAIAIEFCTKSLCEKVKAKIENDRGEWSSKFIAQLLETVYYDIIKEESWQIIKKHKNPTINYSTLKALVIRQIKANLPQIF